MTLKVLLENYSMAQIALISHVSFLKFKDDEKEREKSNREITARGGSGRKHALNKNNAEAAALIMQGLAS